MKIVVVIKGKLAGIPPVISVIDILNELGHNVHVITAEVPKLVADRFKENGIYYEEKNFSKATSKIEKIYEYLAFRYYVSKRLKELDFDLLWVEGGNTIRSLGSCIKSYKYVVQISEMYEKDKAILKSINSIIQQADTVFIPEYNRALIYKVWFNLKKTPLVLPNKPHFLIEPQDCANVLKRYEAVLNPIRNKKIILYQGGIKHIRMLDRIALAIEKMNDNYHLLVVGPEQEKGLINELKEITPEVTHIGFVPSPEYLAFCKLAYVGFVSYQPNSLNNIFCAPNKIFEYSAFGLPMIANDIPGLRFTVGVSGACELVEPTDINSIMEGIRRIENNYSKYKQNSIAFYNSVDNKKTINEVLLRLQ